MKPILRVIQVLYCIYALLIFVLIMLLIFPFVIGCLPFGKIRGGNMIYQLCRFWGGSWYHLVGISHHEIYEAPHRKDEQFIFVANHASYIDIPAVVLATRQPIRILGKKEMVKIPVFGWIYRAAVVLVDRKKSATRTKSVRALKSAIHQQISILIFPEGTFNMCNDPLIPFYDGAFRIAIETQTPIKPLLLIDALERLHYKGLLELTPGKNRVVYLAEIPVKGLDISNLQQLKNQVFLAMEEGLRRYRNYPNR